MPDNQQNSLWSVEGKDLTYEHYRRSDSDSSRGLRAWVDKAYLELAQYLDKGWPDKLRNEDFYGRLWELEMVENLNLTGLKMVPTKGVGPDFCVEAGGRRLWIEAVLARPDAELDEIIQKAIASEKTYDTPRKEIALRYSSSLVGKAEKFSEKYGDYIKKGDLVLLAVSAYQPSSMRSDIDLFMPAILPIDHQMVHFSTNGQPLDPTVARPTHEFKLEHAKKSGVPVKKTFLYPGDDFPHINGVIFSEASNLQQLLGAWSSSFNDSTNRPHVFENFSSMGLLPAEFTKHFYYHRFRENGEMMSLDQLNPEGVTVTEGEVQHG